MSTPSVHLAVLVVATDPAKADLATAMIIRGRAGNAGHQIVQQHVTKDMEAGIRSQLARWIDDPNIDVILVTGNVESDAVAAAIKPLVTQQLQGFTDLFRYLAFQELGAGAMLSTAEAAQCNSTYVFVLPGSAGAVGTAMDKLILPQLDPNTKPKNLVSAMPGVHAREAVPSQIASEKTTGGFGISPKMPAPPRSKPPTARNVIRRAEAEPETRVIDVAKLDRLANPNDAQTKPNIDLRKMLPNVPPGADELDTDTDILVAPPNEKRADTAPAIPPPPSIPAPGSVSRARSTTGPRARPITVPPTSAFATKEGTSPGTGAPAPRPAGTTGSQNVVGSSERRASPTGQQPTLHERPTPPAGQQPSLTERRTSPSGPQSVHERATPPVGQPTATERRTSPTGPQPALSERRASASGPQAIVSKKDSTEPGAVMPTRKPAESGKQVAMSFGTPSAPASTRESARINSGVPNAPASTRESARVAPPPPPKDAFASREKTGESNVATDAKAATDATTGSKSTDDRPASVKPTSESSAARINGVAAKAAAALTPSSITPSVEMAPLLDAKDLDDEPDAKPTPPAKPAARPRAPTPPPPVVAPRDSAVDLPVGTFNYPIKKRRRSKAGTIIALLLAASVGFAAVVYLVPKLTEEKPTRTGQLEPTTAPTPAPAPVIEPPAPVEQPPAPQPDEEPPTPEPTPSPPPKRSSTTPPRAIAKPATTTTAGPITKPDATATTPVDTKPADPEPDTSGCNEVDCVVSKYDRPCCERFKPQSSDLKPRTAGGVPEELDRAAVRTGIEKVKPAVVACGEKSGGVKGTVKIAVEVAPEGNVTSTEVTDSPDTALGACVANAMKKAQFGKSVNGGSFTYPFLF